jgi:aerotaxis receptor
MATGVYVTNVETVLPDNCFIYSRTNLKGVIIEANAAFAEISGYRVDEMVGKPHNLVRHPDMPKEAFADLWKSLKAGRPWQGVVKNRRSDGGFYWVLANVSPVREGGEVIGYQSLRSRPSREQIAAATAAYRQIRARSTSLKVKEGQVVPARSAWAERASSFDFQLIVGVLLALAASLVGLGSILWAADQVFLRDFAVILLGLSGLFALYILLRVLPRLSGDLDRIESYLDQVLSSGDLISRFELSRQDRMGAIGRKLGLLVGWVQSTVQCIGDAVIQVQDGTEQVYKAVMEIDQAASTQSSATASVAAAATELSLTISEVSQHLQTTESTVGATGRKATEGALVSQRASDQIDLLAAAIKTATSEVEALGTSSAEVGAIAGVIREIADQTNLLALNASIEAARAGEAGRGFAVVANEVRSLADRTMKATGKIDSLILTIKGDSDRAIAGMRTGSAQVTEGVALVREAQGALNGINQLMGEAVRKVTEIANAASQQTEAMNDIGANITHVAAMTEQSVGVVHRTTELMGVLTPMVERVKKALAQYEV